MAAHLAFLDKYVAGGSALHRDDARVKVVVTLGFIFATTALPVGAWPAFALMLVLVWGAVVLSQLGIKRMFGRSLLALPFVLVALPTVFTKPGTPIAAFNLGIGHLTATSQGLEFVGSVLLKSWASVTAASLLTATTQPERILESLRSLGIPRLLLATVSFMFRYLFVLADEAQRLLRARSARSARVSRRSGGTLPWRAKVAGGMAGSLFIRTYDRSERIYQAMLARGYDGRVRLLNPSRLGLGGMVKTLGSLGLLAVIVVAAHLVW